MKAKPKPEAPDIEELPDAWERFERAFDTVMKAKPKPMPAKRLMPPASARDGRLRRGPLNLSALVNRCQTQIAALSKLLL